MRGRCQEIQSPENERPRAHRTLLKRIRFTLYSDHWKYAQFTGDSQVPYTGIFFFKIGKREDPKAYSPQRMTESYCTKTED